MTISIIVPNDSIAIICVACTKRGRPRAVQFARAIFRDWDPRSTDYMLEASHGVWVEVVQALDDYADSLMHSIDLELDVDPKDRQRIGTNVMRLTVIAMKLDDAIGAAVAEGGAA